jgi:hypothetical protein
MTGVLDTMTSWTPDAPIRGPGSELPLMRVADVAQTLADGMQGGRILIPSDDLAWDIVRRWADGPDAFIQSKIDAFARGDNGRPSVSDSMRREIAAMVS